MHRRHFVLLLLAVATSAASREQPADLRAVERQVIAATNELRKARGLPLLASEERLARAAAKFARFMARRDEYGHQADGRSPLERARAEGYRECLVAENISYQMRTGGFGTRELAERLVAGWYGSPGHRRNMLDEDAVEVGAAVAYSERTRRYYGVQLFGRPESMRYSFTVRNESRAPAAYRVGDKAWEVPPHTERRHDLCRDLWLVIGPRGGGRPFRPGPGDLFKVTAAGKVEHVPGS